LGIWYAPGQLYS
jgi:hypothetical protein